MASKMYRTALGKQVDMGSLLLQNEDVRAVGNMGVNARGDTIDKKNATVSTKAAQVNQVYRKQIRNQIIDAPIGNIKDSVDEDEIEGFDTPLEVQPVIEETTEETTEETKTKKGGLASAIAKAREIEQKKSLTPREESRGKNGVKKI